MIKVPRRDTHSSVSQTTIHKRLKRGKNVTNCDTKTAKAGKQIYKNVTKSNTRTAIRHWRYGHSDNKQDDLAAPQGHTLICFSNSNTKVANRDTKTAKTWQTEQGCYWALCCRHFLLPRALKARATRKAIQFFSLQSWKPSAFI